MPSPERAPRVPDWFEPGDPWLTEKMRQVAEIAAAERQVGPAVEKALAFFLSAARSRVLGGLPPVSLRAQADLDAWPERESVWRQALVAFLFPVLSTLFRARFSRQVVEVRVTVRVEPHLEDYLDDVWTAMRKWADDVFAVVRDEQRGAVAEGSTDREIHARVADLLRIDAPSARLLSQIRQLRITVADPSTRDSVRRQARARLSVLQRRDDRGSMRWWPLVVQMARTLAVAALNAGTAMGVAAFTEATGERKYKQWWSAEDNRVRAAHIAAHGQVQPVGDFFSVGGFLMRYPGDPVAPPDLTVNCRCGLLTLSRAQAETARAAYETSIRDRTDKSGRRIDDNGRLIAAGQPEGGVSMETAVLDAAPAEVDEDSPPVLADGSVTPQESARSRWSGVLAPLGVRSGDNRIISEPKEGDQVHRNLPLPLLYQEKTGNGHDNAVVVGNIERVWAENGLLMGEGRFDLADQTARDVMRKIDDGFHRWVSVSLDNQILDYHYYRDGERLSAVDVMALAEEETQELDIVRVSTAWRLMSVTLVAEPAFQEAFIGLLAEEPEAVEAQPVEAVAAAAAAPSAEKRERADSSGAAMPGGRYPIENAADLRKAIKAVGRAGGAGGTDADRNAVRRHIIKRAKALGLSKVVPDSWNSDGTITADGARQTHSWAEQVAAAVPAEPPVEWFSDPGLTGPTKIRVTDEGRVYGHIAAWGSEHAAMPGVQPPRSADASYTRFHRHPVRCAGGERVKTGPLATGGHADIEESSLWSVMRHYDDPTFVAADVVCGEDEHGIWVSGSLRPGISAFQVMILDRYSLSGDWRYNELVAACAVSVPGFHLDDDTSVVALAASAGAGALVLADPGVRARYEDEFDVVALVAAGVVPGSGEAGVLLRAEEMTVRLDLGEEAEVVGRRIGEAMFAGMRDAQEAADRAESNARLVGQWRKRVDERKNAKVEAWRERMLDSKKSKKKVA